MKMKRMNLVSFVLSATALGLFLISIVIALVQGDITQAFPLTAIFLLIDGVPISEFMFEIVALALFIATIWSFTTSVLSFRKRESGKE